MAVSWDESVRRFQAAKRLFLELKSLAPDERDAAIRRHAHADPDLAARVETLLALDSESGPVWFSPDGGHDTKPAMRRLGRYEILERLGQGGQGEVFLAFDPHLRRRVAVKVLNRRDHATDLDLERFRREAEAASRLTHPGICVVHEGGWDDGSPYIVMGLVEGVPLSAELEVRRALGPAGDRGQPASVARFVEVVEKVARALHVAHESGIVHRDIKPTNIMLRPNGDPVVMDFGLAHLDGPDLQTLTQSGDLFGTAPYMSPEQLLAHHVRLDRRTDVWSLGVVLYECVTLERPFGAATRSGLFHAIQAREPVDPRRLNRAISDDLCAVIEHALEKDRERRFASALDFAEELRRVREHEPVRSRRAGPIRRVSKWARRNPGIAASLGGIVVVTIAGLLVAGSLVRRLTAENVLADVARLQILSQESDRLWPAEPRNLPALSRWLSEAEAIIERTEAHRDDRRPIAQVGPVRARALWAATILERSLIAPASLWSDAVRSIGDPGTCESYHGLRLLPQVGLVPIGIDPASGLWEFAHLETAAGPEVIPVRDREGRLSVEPEHGIVFVLIPGGAGPPFFLSKFEMTQAQWLRLTGDNPSGHPFGTAVLGRAIRSTHPVEQVSWEDADLWLRRLGLQLPTQKQWEFAARAGTSTEWWCGSTKECLRGAANVADASLGKADGINIEQWNDGFPVHAPVGTFAPNAFGLCDILGNVFEWCDDSMTASKRPFRGGGHSFNAAHARISFKSDDPMFNRDNFIGVRPARSICAVPGQLPATMTRLAGRHPSGGER